MLVTIFECWQQNLDVGVRQLWLEIADIGDQNVPNRQQHLKLITNTFHFQLLVTNILLPPPVANINVAQTNFFKNSLQHILIRLRYSWAHLEMITTVLFRLKYFNCNLVPGGLNVKVGWASRFIPLIQIENTSSILK